MEATPHPLRSPMPEWRRHLSVACTEHEIVQLARDYVATWSPEEMFRLPEECRPGHVREGDDISHCAYELARAHCSLRYVDDIDRLLMRMLAFMSEAAMRLAAVKTLEAAADRS